MARTGVDEQDETNKAKIPKLKRQLYKEEVDRKVLTNTRQLSPTTAATVASRRGRCTLHYRNKRHRVGRRHRTPQATDATGEDAAGEDATRSDDAGEGAAREDATGTNAAREDAAGEDAAREDATGTNAATEDAAGENATGTDNATGTNAAGEENPREESPR